MSMWEVMIRKSTANMDLKIVLVMVREVKEKPNLDLSEASLMGRADNSENYRMRRQSLIAISVALGSQTLWCCLLRL